MEPLLRMTVLPAFMARDAVDATRAHPDIDSMWDPITCRERELMAARQGILNKLRRQPVVDMPAMRS